MSTRQIVLNDPETQVPLRVRTSRCMSDDEYFEFCGANPDLRIERAATGEIVIMAPTGGEAGYREGEVHAQLRNWAKRDGRGKSFGPSTGYILPDHSALPPDASWIESPRLQALNRNSKRKFIPLCPDFLIELTSPSDRLHEVREKMSLWMANGAQLGWLIDADRKTIYVYRPGRAAEQLSGIEILHGEGPVAGFVLELADIFAEL